VLAGTVPGTLAEGPDAKGGGGSGATGRAGGGAGALAAGRSLRADPRMSVGSSSSNCPRPNAEARVFAIEGDAAATSPGLETNAARGAAGAGGPSAGSSPGDESAPAEEYAPADDVLYEPGDEPPGEE
jgi:hypothetical protein